MYQEPLIPSVHTVLQNRVDQANQSVLALVYIVANLQLVLQQSFELLRRVVFHERSPRRAALDGETVASVFGVCIAVCGSNEWDYELLNGIKQLSCMSVVR